MLTKDQIIELTAQAELGEFQKLASLFDYWREIGLLPQFAKKEKVRGGKGLWPDPVFHIWIAMLRNRAAGIRVSTLANIPVGCWLTGYPGFDLATAQRAFSYWLDRHEKGRRPTGDRSLRERLFAQILDDLGE